MTRGWGGARPAPGGVLALLLVAVPGALGQAYPPPSLEITPDHPLLMFSAPPGNAADPDTHAQQVIAMWSALSEDLRPYSVIVVDLPEADSASKHVALQSICALVQPAGVAVVVQLADGKRASFYPLGMAEELFDRFTCIKGIQAADLSFNDYYAFGDESLGAPPHVRWLVSAIDLSARYGRLMAIRLGENEWLHAMSNVWGRPLLEKMRMSAPYVAAIGSCDSSETIAQQGALMGLWLERTVNQWGLAATSRWYARAGFDGPGRFAAAPGAPMPAAFYRAMLLNGAMGGATVFAFLEADELWAGQDARYWIDVIGPTLREIIEKGLISRAEFVAKRAPVAYQVAAARDPVEFRRNLRDLDARLDEGRLLRGAYGVERPGQVAELVPNTGAHYWVPIVSPYAPGDSLALFRQLVSPGAVGSAQEWTELLDRFHVPDGMGPAFVTRVGRGVFVMHTRENLYQEQGFRIPALPEPVRGFEARRVESGVAVSWPFREGDVSYSVYRRAYPDGRFERVAEGLRARNWTDVTASAAESVAYAVTALTNEQAPYEGTVNYGDFLAFSAVESRIAEEAVLTPLVSQAQASPIAAADSRPKEQEWWPTFEGVADVQMPDAREIAARIEEWERAFVAEDLDAVMAVYAPEYRDPQYWPLAYVRRAYQWFFERYRARYVVRQIRRWDFSSFEAEGVVRVVLYCRFTGVATSDTSGRVAHPLAWFPRHESGEVRLTFAEQDGIWRLLASDPALPNFRDMLSFSADPFGPLPPGPDVYDGGR